MAITKSLAKRISNYQNMNSLGSRFRRKRAVFLISMIEKVNKEKGSVNIIDIGGTRTYWKIIPRDYLASKNCQITLANLKQPNNTEDVIFHEVIADGRQLEFSDKSFDVAHSNSVLEHVGSWNDMVLFAKEVARVSKIFFVQTPSYWFPIEPHAMFPFFHWLPVSTRKMLIMRYELGHLKRAVTEDEADRIVASLHLLKKKQVKELFPEATIKTEWFLFPKSYIAIKV